jgi:hypothetical protein
MEMLDGEIMGIDVPSLVSKYCRKCEFACPVAKERRQKNNHENTKA